jgi:hypothetical protein
MNGGFTINLISGTHHLFERSEYTANILREYSIIICTLVPGHDIFSQMIKFEVQIGFFLFAAKLIVAHSKLELCVFAC